MVIKLDWRQPSSRRILIEDEHYQDVSGTTFALFVRSSTLHSFCLDFSSTQVFGRDSRGTRRVTWTKTSSMEKPHQDNQTSRGKLNLKSRCHVGHVFVSRVKQKNRCLKSKTTQVILFLLNQDILVVLTFELNS